MLHCDRIPLPEDWVWTCEQGCREWSDLAALQRQQVALLEELVERRASGFTTSTDLWVEALVMLYYTGARNPVRPE